MGFEEGGIEIEEVVEKMFEKIFKEYVDFVIGL